MQEQGPWLVLSTLGRPEEEGLFVVTINKAGPGRSGHRWVMAV